MSEVISAPWDASTIEVLRKRQAMREFHPYTCGIDSRHALLEPTADGWVCPDCDYRQTWAHAAEPSLVELFA